MRLRPADCISQQPHRHAAVWTIGLKWPPVGYRILCAAACDWPALWRSRADPNTRAGRPRLLLIVAATGGRRAAAWLPSTGYRHPAVAEKIARMLEQTLHHE